MTKMPSAYFYSQKQNKIFYFSQPTWGFAYYPTKRICLLTGEEFPFDGAALLERFDYLVSMRRTNPRVDILFYEMNKLGRVKFQGDELLLISLEFEQTLKGNFKSKVEPVVLKQVSAPIFQNYEKKFKSISNNLLAGDCYQVNFTEKFIYTYDQKNIDWAEYFFSSQFASKLGAYAHVIKIPILNKVIMSNSPECLFQVHQKKKLITSMPIKGTISDNQDPKDLLNSTKNESELFMIADLIRNDLAKLKPYEARVLKKKKILKVPGLFHQYSLVGNRLRPDLKLRDLVSSLFPGGSITGAPKKRVCEIIERIEDQSREVYCGSTILHWKNILTSSINIRTAMIDTKKQTLDYGAGGGITLKSNCAEEFEELHQKNRSFIQSFFSVN
jgi:para-aminobenzoate synthetase component 1